MSFMYETMMTRGPGKRKIKLQEENLLSLMQEEDDDEEDEDFEVKKYQHKKVDESSDSSDDSCSTSSKDSSSSESTSDEETSNKPTTSSTSAVTRRQRKYRRQAFIPPTIASTNDAINDQKHGVATTEILAKAQRQFELSISSVAKFRHNEYVKICCICLKKRNINSIINCNSCGISVHKDCYNDNLRFGHFTRSNSSWFCSSCISGSSPTCEFCPIEYGCLKETTTGRWCHTVCARYIRGKEFHRNASDFINISSVNHKLYGLHECMLCEDRLVAKTGICVKCDAGLCKSYFHVTCAQKYGLLSENESNQNCDSDPYFVYCPLHMEKEKMAESQKLFIAVQASAKKMKERIRANSTRESERSSYIHSQQLKYPTLPTVGTPPSRLLTSSPAALKILNKKAELLFGIDVRSPAVYFPKPSEVRKRHHVPPALTGEFASHYVDRELRIVEMQERVEKMTEENEKMIETQTELEQKYENLQAKLNLSQKQEKQIVSGSRRLFTMFLRLKMWSEENKRASLQNAKLMALKPIIESASGSTEDRLPNKRKLSDAGSETRAKTSKTVEISSSVFSKRRCGECKSDKHQHLMIDCDVCKRWLHLQCLDPPLSHMPKKNKFSIWQCSLCASSSGSDSDVEKTPRGSLITSEGRRQTQRLHKPPEKLATSLLYHHKRKNVEGQMRRMIEKGRIKKRQPQVSLKRRQTSVNKSDLAFKIRRELNIKREKLQLPATSGNQSVSRPSVKVKRETEINKVIRPNLTWRVPENDKFFISPKFPNHIQQKAAFKSIQLPVRPRMTFSVTPTTLSGSPHPLQTKDKDGLYLNKSIHVILPQPKVSGQSGRRYRNIQRTPAKSVVVKNTIRQRKDISNASNSVSSLPRKQISPASTKTSTVNSGPTLVVKKEKVVESPPVSKVKSVQNIQSVSKNKKDVKDLQKSSTVSTQEKDSAPPPSCNVCHVSNDVDKMMFCRTCERHYHIWCCDPPMRTKPRGMNRFYSWECSECHHTSSESDCDDVVGSETTSDGRRKITRRRKPPEKFFNTFNSPHQKQLMKKVLCRRQNSMKQKNLENETASVTKKELKKSRPKITPMTSAPLRFTVIPVLPNAQTPIMQSPLKVTNTETRSLTKEKTELDAFLTNQKFEVNASLVNQKTQISSSFTNQKIEVNSFEANQKPEVGTSMNNRNVKASKKSFESKEMLKDNVEVRAREKKVEKTKRASDNIEVTVPEKNIIDETKKPSDDIEVTVLEKNVEETKTASNEGEVNTPEENVEETKKANDVVEVDVSVKNVEEVKAARGEVAVPEKNVEETKVQNDEMKICVLQENLESMSNDNNEHNVQSGSLEDIDISSSDSETNTSNVSSCTTETITPDVSTSIAEVHISESCLGDRSEEKLEDVNVSNQAENSMAETNPELTNVSVDTESNSSTVALKSFSSVACSSDSAILIASSIPDYSPSKNLVTVVLPKSPTKNIPLKEHKNVLSEDDSSTPTGNIFPKDQKNVLSEDDSSTPTGIIFPKDQKNELSEDDSSILTGNIFPKEQNNALSEDDSSSDVQPLSALFGTQ